MNDLRAVASTDLQDLLALSGAAGWNQTPADWIRALSLGPGLCFGIVDQGRVISTTTAICYGEELAWIGMVLTHPEHRGKGHARRLMEHVIALVRQRGVRTIRLDATEQGRPLYESLGFVDEGPIERRRRQAAAFPGSNGFQAVDPDYSLDLAAFGADRSSLLRSLGSGEATWVEGGFAMSRPGTNATYFGPCVARTAGAARILSHWFVHAHAGADTFWDVLPEQTAASALASELGFTPVRRLRRMRLGDPRSAGRPDWIYAIAGFEFG